MERLLADAQKLSGVEYNLDNLGDVYEAIHVIQTDLGLTGVAAQEASTTFTGSLGAMKAAGENLMANLALGEDIRPALDTLGQTVNTFLFNNLIPMMGNIFTALPDLVSGLGSMIIGALNQISNNSDQLVQTGIQIVTSLVSAIVEAAPYLVEAAWNLAASLGEALINTDWATIGTNLLTSLRDSIDLAAGKILGMDSATVDGFLSGITNSLPGLLDKGIEFITTISDGILANLPQLITTAGELITTFASFLLENAPIILEKGAELVLNLANGLISNLPLIAEAAVVTIVKFLATIATQLPQILTKGIEIIGKLAAGLIQAIPKVISAISQVVRTIIATFKEYDWKQIGLNILEGVKNGILSAVSGVIDAAKSAAEGIWNAVKGFFQISSPSKLMFYAGEMIDAGLASGIANNQDMVDNAVETLSNSAASQLKTQMSFNPRISGKDSKLEEKVDNLYKLLGAYLPEIADGYGKIVLEGDAGRLFRLMQRESVRNTQLVGGNSVLSAT